MVIRTIIVMCLSQYGFNVKNSDNYTLMTPVVASCVDRVSACYYSKKGGDVFKCIKALDKEAALR